MTGADIWIIENVVNMAATGGAALVCYARWRSAAWKSYDARARKESVILMRRRNARRMAKYVRQNLALCALGGYLIWVAARWTRPVPGFVLWGTGGFAAIWVYAAIGEITDWLDVSRAVELAERGE